MAQTHFNIETLINLMFQLVGLILGLYLNSFCVKYALFIFYFVKHFLSGTFFLL